MIKLAFTFSEAEAAMCLWEDCLRRCGNGEGDAVFDWLRCEEGAAAARQKCLELAEVVELSYDIAFADGYDDSFDWEFVPRWLDLAMEQTAEFREDHECWAINAGFQIAHEFKTKVQHG